MKWLKRILLGLVILALITPLVCSGTPIAENISIDLDDIAVDVGDFYASRDIDEDFRSERLKANLLIFGILGIIFVGAYISMRPLQHVKINSVATSCNM